MSGSINDMALLMKAAVKKSGPINKVETCYTAVLKLQNVDIVVF